MYRHVPLLPFVLIAGCAVLLVLLTAASARRGLPRPLPGGRAVVVRHNHVFRWSVLAIAVLAPVGLTVVLRFVPPVRTDVPYLLGVYLVFTGIMVPLVWEAGRYYLLASPDGLEGRSAWRGTRVLRWDELEGVGYSALNACFEFRGRGGRTIRAFTFAAGLHDLFRLIEAHVPPALLTRARAGYARVGRPFPPLPDEPVLEARAPRL
jgi:hypothetical protein